MGKKEKSFAKIYGKCSIFFSGNISEYQFILEILGQKTSPNILKTFS